jgi:hypothetical protein
MGCIPIQGEQPFFHNPPQADKLTAADGGIEQRTGPDTSGLTGWAVLVMVWLAN